MLFAFSDAILTDYETSHTIKTDNEWGKNYHLSVFTPFIVSLQVVLFYFQFLKGHFIRKEL